MAELGSLPADPAELCKAIARIVSQTMGGSSGPAAYPKPARTARTHGTTQRSHARASAHTATLGYVSARRTAAPTTEPSKTLPAALYVGVLIAIFFSAAAAAIERDRSRPALVVGAAHRRALRRCVRQSVGGLHSIP
jgi:hypothetical protein